MESPGISPVTAGGEDENQDYMFRNEHFAANFFRLRPENIVHVGESPHPTCGKDYCGCANSIPEEEPFHNSENINHCRILPLITMQKENSYHGREPITGGKIVGETVENNSGFFDFC